MLALPVQAAVISPGSENVRRSTVTKTAVSPKTGEGTGESVALLLACVSASAAVFGRPETEREDGMKKLKVVCDHTFSCSQWCSMHWIRSRSDEKPDQTIPKSIHGSG